MTADPDFMRCDYSISRIIKLQVKYNFSLLNRATVPPVFIHWDSWTR